MDPAVRMYFFCSSILLDIQIHLACDLLLMTALKNAQSASGLSIGGWKLEALGRRFSVLGDDQIRHANDQGFLDYWTFAVIMVCYWEWQRMRLREGEELAKSRVKS